MKQKRVVIIGGGAAGFFAAINLAERQPNYKVIIVEKTSKLLTKVQISGGGRCNITHSCFDNNELVKSYPRGEKQLKSVFSRFAVQDTINWFEERGIPLHTEEDGRMFPTSNNAKTISDFFINTAEQLGIEILLKHEVEAIIQNNTRFEIIIKNNETLQADAIISTSGGSNKRGGYNYLAQLNHRIVPPSPSLFTFNINDKNITKLMGVSMSDVMVSVLGTKLKTKGDLLITHWGMSGPAILKASAFGATILKEQEYKFKLKVNWLPQIKEEALRNLLQEVKSNAPQQLISKHPQYKIAKRLWEYFVVRAEINLDCKWVDLSKKQTNKLINILHHDEYDVTGKTTFKEEFVTCGGIDLKEINLSTMESKIVPNVFFAGEVIDVDGITGGFNFQNAWSTAHIAANNCL